MYALLVVVGSLFAGIGVVVAPAWFLVPLGIGFFFAGVWLAPSLRISAYAGALFGGVTAGMGLWWLWEMLPSTTIWNMFSAGLMWLVPTLALGAVAVPLALMLYLTRANVFAPLIAVALFLMHEELRMWAWALVTYGSGSLFGPHFSITAFGYALAEEPYLLALAEGVGLLMLSMTVALIGAAIASGIRALQNAPQARLSTGIIVLVLIGVLVLPLSKNNAPVPQMHLRVAVFSTYTDRTGNTTAPYDPTELEKDLATADIVVLPEGKSLATVFSEEAQLQRLEEAWFSKKNVMVISSHTTADGTALRNTVQYESTRDGVLASQDKIFLMPEGEYLPVLASFFLALLPDATLPTIGTGQHLSPGNRLISVPIGEARLGTLLCSEVMSPHLYRRLAKEHGANVLVNLSDPSWFHGSRLLFAKTLAIAKVHAVQNHAYFLAAQNSTPAYIIDPNGRVVEMSAWGHTTALLFDL